MNPFKELAHERDDVIEMRLEQPVPAAEQMEFGIRQIAQIGPRRFFRHVVVVGTPDDQGGRPVFAQVFAVFRKPGPVLLQSGDQVYGNFLAPRRDQRPMQLPEIGRDRIGQGGGRSLRNSSLKFSSLIASASTLLISDLGSVHVASISAYFGPRASS